MYCLAQPVEEEIVTQEGREEEKSEDEKKGLLPSDLRPNISW